MSKIKFQKAMLLIEGKFFNQLSRWPEWFPPVNLAVLQSPLKDINTRAWEHAIESAVKTGELASTLKPYLLRLPIFDLSKEFDEQLIPCDQDTITATDFAAWLTKQDEKPSELIAAWIAAVGAQAKDGDNAPAQTAAMPAPVGGKRWTTERLAELKAYREAHTMRETAEKFTITEQRIRQLLPRPKANPFAGTIHRMK